MDLRGREGGRRGPRAAREEREVEREYGRGLVDDGQRVSTSRSPCRGRPARTTFANEHFTSLLCPLEREPVEESREQNALRDNKGYAQLDRVEALLVGVTIPSTSFSPSVAAGMRARLLVRLLQRPASLAAHVRLCEVSASGPRNRLEVDEDKRETSSSARREGAPHCDCDSLRVVREPL